MAAAEQTPPVPPAAPELETISQEPLLPPPPPTPPPTAPAPPKTAPSADSHPPPRSRNSIIISSTSGEGSDIYEIRPGGSVRRRSRHSQASSNRTYSSASSDSSSWDKVDHPYDDIEPSDSASRSRQPSRRPIPEERPVPTRRHSSRRVAVDPSGLPRRHASSHRRHTSRPRRSESRRTPSDESDVASSYDDYPGGYGHQGAPPAPAPPRGAPYPPHSGFRHVPAGQPGHGGYPPSMSSAPYADPYAAQALVHMPHEPFGMHGQPNPFQPPPSNPFSPISNGSGTSYFPAEAHAPHVGHGYRPPGPPRPTSFAAPPTHYGSELTHFGTHPGMGYPYGMPPGMNAAYPPWAYAPPPTASPPPKEDKERAAELDSLKALIQKHEEARLAAEKARLEKEKAEAAEKAAAAAQEIAEKKRKEEVDAASKSAKEAAEKKAEEAAKKAKEEHEKKLAEAKAAKETAEKKQKELEEEAKKNKPEPDTLKKPIRFKDAVGRKFSFPFHLCKTWKGMEGLIRQAFLHVDGIGEHVAHGHYDLTGPDGEILLPQVWETMIQPDSDITMHMWPMPEPPKEDKLAAEAAMLADPFGGLGLGDLGLLDPGKGKGKKRDGSKKKNKGHPQDHIIDVGPSHGMPPPPPHHGGVLPPDMLYDGLLPMERKRSKPRSKSKEVSGLTAWMIGGRVPSKKK